ncbi:MAG: M61 family peptidase, partial [Chitinophagaceae bacterium]
PVPVSRTDGDVYEVSRHDGFIRVEYTLFANHPDGTYAGIDPSSIHLNAPATFLWLKGADKAPIDVKFNLPSGKAWTIATQLKAGADSTLFTARDLQYLMDSPISIGELHWEQWSQVNPDKKTYNFRLALEATGGDSSVKKFAKNLSRITGQAQAVFGELPAFDYGTYTFLAGINPYVKGDGMEHRNSTVINIPMQFTGNSVPSVFAHEFFHCWNVERIRPKSLEPFNFEKSNMSEGLWIAEGFTQYYGALLMKRAGLTSEGDFMQQMAGLINAKENTPGGTDYTPVENSQRAVFVDAGVAVDQTNYPNMFTSYYTYGGALALALDLRLRKEFNKSLDGFMQQLWKVFGKPEKAYTLPEVQQVLAAYASPGFASAFFKQHVYGHEPIDYKALLQAAGYDLKKNSRGEGWMGNVRYAQDTTQVVVAGGTIRNTPLYKAGVDVDDVIVALDGTTVRQPKDMSAVLAKHKAGDIIRIAYKHRGELVEKDLTL